MDACRAGNAGFGEAVARLGAMPLDQYAREGAALEIRVPWCRKSLWFVPVDSDADILGHEGVSRGRICTARELVAAVAILGSRPYGLRAVVLTKLVMDGHVVEVKPPANS